MAHPLLQASQLIKKQTMKKTLRITSLLFITTTLLFFAGCKKSSTGPAGKDGSANVTATTYSAGSWAWSSPNYYVNLSVPELTSANINSAAVMVYFKTANNWIAVPYTQYNSPADYYMNFNTSVGNVQVTWFYDSSLSSGSDPNAYYSTTVQYKVVVIPPTVAKANPGLNLKDYAAVKTRFNLPD